MIIQKLKHRRPPVLCWWDLQSTIRVGDEVLNDELNKIKVVNVEKLDGLTRNHII